MERRFHLLALYHGMVENNESTGCAYNVYQALCESLVQGSHMCTRLSVRAWYTLVPGSCKSLVPGWWWWWCGTWY